MFEFVGGHEEHPWDWKSSIRVMECFWVAADVVPLCAGVEGVDIVVNDLESLFDTEVDIWDVSGPIQTLSDFLNIFLRFHIPSESTI